ncbi:helix-turn-helix transcriptional regulator [Microbispora sp. GKU 823]|uniref:helix-turn-helix domain-containing protein n=1 Tax=Microbispora sp. GKU 823 TaxID=1652100 RepID=UPI0009C4801A|nr:helix-turn-helix transcriptional regulator [Microbispora sp. GKU 823]OPG13664.1 hypothetical protein B1L11_06665 [Microbispora sp. GKU 823]
MSIPSGDWPTLARTVRERRQQLGIPTQQAAAERAGLSLNSWQRLEAGTPVSVRTVQAAARVLGWRPGALMAVLNGHPAPDAPAPAEAEPGAVLPVDRPALVYLGTDGSIVQLDRADLTTMPARERALCVALLDHARHQLDQAGVSAVAYHAARIPTTHDHQEDPHA